MLRNPLSTTGPVCAGMENHVEKRKKFSYENCELFEEEEISYMSGSWFNYTRFYSL